MQKWEFSFMDFMDNKFTFHELNHEPRLLFTVNKSSILGFSSKPDPDFSQVMLKAINMIAAEGWELFLIGPGGLVWYFKRPIED